MDTTSLSTFSRDGSVLIPNFLDENDIADMRAWVTDVASWSPASVGLGYTLHHETVCDGTRLLCRVENFTPLHGGLASISERAAALASAALGRKALLFKEKINIKPPQGRGYGAHYDGPSAAAMGFGAQNFVTVQIAVDDQSVENGCLQVVSPRGAWPVHRNVIAPVDDDPDMGGRVGAIPDETADFLDFSPIECKAGDALVFDHWAPHRSGPNRSDTSRRTLYFIFNAADEGDWRAAYYEKMAEMRSQWAKRRQVVETTQATTSAAEEGPTLVG